MVQFAGNGKMDVGDGSMMSESAPKLMSGGPMVSPVKDGDMTADGKIVNSEGSVPGGSGVTFTMGNDW